MASIVQPTNPTSQWAALTLPVLPSTLHFSNIKTHLDLLLLALEAIGEIGSEAVLQTALDLNLESIISSRVALWRLRQASPLRKGQQGRKRMDVDEARALSLIICHLARQHYASIRQAVALLQQCHDRQQQPHQTVLLGNYLDRFHHAYHDRMRETEQLSTDTLTKLSLKLLADLAFYGSTHGPQRLWQTLLAQSIESASESTESTESTVEATSESIPPSLHIP